MCTILQFPSKLKHDDITIDSQDLILTCATCNNQTFTIDEYRNYKCAYCKEYCPVPDECFLDIDDCGDDDDYDEEE